MNRVQIITILAALSIIAIFVLVAVRFNQTRDSRDFQLDPSPTTMVQDVTGTSSPSLSTTPHADQVMIYMIALEDNGKSGTKIGCNDSLVPVAREVEGVENRIQKTLELLFSLKDQYYGESGLYNSLYQSDLSVDEIVESESQVTVRLMGKMTLAGTCDSPRFQEQIENTVEQFTNDKTVVIFLNNIPLSQALSTQ